MQHYISWPGEIAGNHRTIARHSGAALERQKACNEGLNFKRHGYIDLGIH